MQVSETIKDQSLDAAAGLSQSASAVCTRDLCIPSVLSNSRLITKKTIFSLRNSIKGNDHPNEDEVPSRLEGRVFELNGRVATDQQVIHRPLKPLGSLTRMF